MGSCWLLLALGMGAGVQPTEFQVDTDTPDALCPEISLTRDAVRQRLGELEVEGGGLWRGLYTTVHDPAGRRGDYVRLVILDPSGKEQASRELPVKGVSCATLAQAIALVVEGFFRDLGQTPGRDQGVTDSDLTNPPTESKEVVPSKVANVTKAPVAPGATVPSAAGSKPPESAPGSSAGQSYPDGRMQLAIGSGYESLAESAAAYVGWFIAATPSWRVGLRGGLPLDAFERPFRDGQTKLYGIPLRLSLSYRVEVASKFTVHGGPELLISLEHGSTEGISGGREGWRASLGAGGQVSLAYRLSSRFALAGSISAAGILVNGRRFMLESDRELETPRGRLAGSLELWGVMSR